MSYDRAYEDHLDHVASEIRLASGLTAELFANVITSICTRFSVLAKAGKTARIRQLIEAGAQLDAALALIEIELPQWRLRRLALDRRSMVLLAIEATGSADWTRRYGRLPARTYCSGNLDCVHRSASHGARN